jgi:hypothetical protein
MRKLEKIQSMEFILSQFFTCIEFSCVILTDQIFLNDLFHSEFGELEPSPGNNLSLALPHLKYYFLASRFLSQPEMIQQSKIVSTYPPVSLRSSREVLA